MTDGGAWCSGRGRGPCSAARPWLVWLATLAVALSATAFIYSSEVYPELPAGLALVGALLVVTGRERLSPTRALALVLLLSALPWLGAKYAPLAALVALYVLWRAEPRGRAVLVAGGTLSASATPRSTSRPTSR